VTSPTYVIPAGTAADGEFAVVVTPQTAGWDYAGLAILSLEPGQSAVVETGQSEALLLSLAGSCDVACDGESFHIVGRTGVFGEVSDFAYLPRGAAVTVSSAGGGRFAVPSAVCDRTLPFRYGPVGGVEVELRGAGQASRQVNNFCTPQTFETVKLIACEVLTPGGNWSSYPPHKHDQQREGESELEEIYYFEVADGPAGPGIGYHRVYGHDDREIDVLAEVRSGDVVLVPFGWHGPSIAAPGYDLYYLNVMAGPAAERAWLICDDPAHSWVRDGWTNEAVDARLPFASTSEPIVGVRA
jgi:5-deoxy-glucuronate isomerase